MHQPWKIWFLTADDKYVQAEKSSKRAITQFPLPTLEAAQYYNQVYKTVPELSL